MRAWIGRDIIEPVGHVVTGCRDCDQLTGGRCWRHATSVYVVPTYVVQPIVISPEVIQMLGPSSSSD